MKGLCFSFSRQRPIGWEVVARYCDPWLHACMVFEQYTLHGVRFQGGWNETHKTKCGSSRKVVPVDDANGLPLRTTQLHCFAPDLHRSRAAMPGWPWRRSKISFPVAQAASGGVRRAASLVVGGVSRLMTPSGRPALRHRFTLDCFSRHAPMTLTSRWLDHYTTTQCRPIQIFQLRLSFAETDHVKLVLMYRWYR